MIESRPELHGRDESAVDRGAVGRRSSVLVTACRGGALGGLRAATVTALLIIAATATSWTAGGQAIDAPRADLGGQQSPADSRTPTTSALTSEAVEGGALTGDSPPAVSESTDAPIESSEGSTAEAGGVPSPGEDAETPFVGSAESRPNVVVADWPSGVYLPGSDPSRAAAFAAWRGRELDVVVDWSARATWEDIVNPDWLYRAWKGTPYAKVFGVAMLPEADPTATLTECARGAYEEKWLEFGSRIAASGIADETIIRLGWEFNGDWYKWSAREPAEWIACWRHIVTAVERNAPNLRWDWSVNRGVGHGLTDPREAYPGDAFVDIVGVDSYDMWPGVQSEAQWQEHLAGPFGLLAWKDFAREHGKKLSVPEWGVFPGPRSEGQNGGDNALYVRRMNEFFASLGSLLAYEAYFNDAGGYYGGAIWAPVQNPLASSAYREAHAG